MERLRQKELTLLKAALAQAKTIAIVTHFNPDGDAIGSSLALYHYFKDNGYDVRAILPNDFPDFLKWMPDSSDLIIAEKQLKLATQRIADADILCVVDMNAAHRSGKQLEQAITDSKAFKILIDHHLLPDIDCQIKLSNTETSSASELVYDFLFRYLKQKQCLTKDIAECLYVGMITDTGSLSYMCNRPETYDVLKDLIKHGVDGEQIHRNVYDNYTESRFNLLGIALRNLKVMPEISTSHMHLSLRDLRKCGYQIGDTEGFVNYGLSMKTVQFTAFFIERENRIRISFRSKGNFDVSQFARKHFNGGGHKNASAAFYYDTLENTIAYFESLLPLYQNELSPKS